MAAARIAAWLALAAPAPAAAAQEAQPGHPFEEVPETLAPEAARASLERSLAWLVEAQNESGSWGTGALDGLLELGFSVESYYDWQVAACALAVMALAEAEETPARRAALERGVNWLCTTRLPARGSDWDVDYTWPALYGTVACVRLAEDPRFGAAPWSELVRARGGQFLAILLRNQAPDGGWAYYDDPPFARRPHWSTSFCTALVLPSLARAQDLGWGPEPAVLERATRYVRRCALPNGAYEYDLRPVPRISGGEHINDVKGSLGRIQVCNWGLASVGEPHVTPDRLREGLDAFFREHRFLDVARMRPIPHEAYYFNAGYFYFFAHYYAALAIELLPAEEREALHARLRPHLVKTQRQDGSCSDFLGSSYMVTASTALSALALEAGLVDPGS
jgi:hypothetical protein